MKTDKIKNDLDIMIPNPKCELNYNKDYELLIAVMLSAQCTDKRVNIVTKKLFEKYTLKDLSILEVKQIENEIKSLGSYTKKAYYISEISKKLLNENRGIVPNDREFLESLPGVGRKSANVVLSELFDEPTIAVDTHVERVSKRLNLASENDNVLEIEKKLQKKFDKKDYNRINHQLVLFGRYICKSKKPNCDKCLFNCKYRQN